MLEVAKKVDLLWDDNPIDITQEANFIWSIANKLRGSYMPDKYGDVIIPMTIIRRLECALEPTKTKVVDTYKANPMYPAKAMYKISEYPFYNTSKFTLAELCNDPDHIKDNFKSYITGFSSNVQDILNELSINSHIDKMNKDGCLYTVVKAFSELDLSPLTYDSIKMGYIFENLIGRFFQNVDAGQYYTGRDIIKLCVSILISEGCDDIFEDGKIITVCDQACGTGGMLSTAYSYLKHYNPTADVRLFGQELMGVSYAVGLAEMLIKGQNADNFRHADTFKEDCFPDTKMRFLLENPPFGTPWAGADAKEGQEQAVRDEFLKAPNGRWGAGLPNSRDSQLLFLQSAIAKMDDNLGRAAIIENGSSLFVGDTSSGESQIRKFLLENDLIEAIVQLPCGMFYNTGIPTYIWILSKNKREERKGKVQLIDASNVYHKLWKPIGDKKNEFTPEDRATITKMYADFKESEYCKIYRNTEFLYREYTVMQPLQRSYGITQDRIDSMICSGMLSNLYDEGKVYELENKLELTGKEKDKLDSYKRNKPVYDTIIETLTNNISDKLYMNPESFTPILTKIMVGSMADKISKKDIDKLVVGLSKMDKNADIQKDKQGEIIYDKDTKDIELVPFEIDIADYMKEEVLPYVPDAKAFFEENLNTKKPTIKTGAEIPFLKYFYKHIPPKTVNECQKSFSQIEEKIMSEFNSLFSNINACSKEMKDSNIPWCEEIPQNWRTVPNKYVMSKIKEICPIYKGEDILSLTMNGVIVRDLDAGGKMPATFDGYQKIYPNNLLMCLFDYDVTPRCIGLIKNEGLTSPAYSQFLMKNNNSSRYYYYYYLMIDNTKEILHLAKNLRHSFTEDQLGALKVPIPDLDEQEKIANFLDEKCSAIDNIIAEKKKQIEILENYKETLIYEYVTGKKEVL